MTQETRKDRRVKVVSLNVRYKSATVDEFIDNHSHDVSKGGIFIKTATPFPPGTLLKFEIRLSGDQAVIAGVGRVVWKRETAQADAERPAGMGVKFIKLDDASKGVIDKLVVRADAGKAFESEEAEDGPTMASPSPRTSGAPAASPPPTSPQTSVVKPQPLTPTRQGMPAVAGAARKQTIMGMGSSPAPAPAAGVGLTSSGAPPSVPRPSTSAASSGPLSARGGPVAAPVVSASGSVTSAEAKKVSAATQAMFPETNSAGDMPPPQEQTMMRQTAELLEEALKEAGGSLDEIGQNPLFAAPPSARTPEPPAAVGAEGHAHPTTERGMGAAKPVVPADTPSADGVDALLSSTGSEPEPKVSSSDRSMPPTRPDSPSAKLEASQPDQPVSARDAARDSVRPSRRAPPAEVITADSIREAGKDKKGGGTFIVVATLVIAAGVGLFLFKDQLFGAPSSGGATPSATAPPPTAATSTSLTAVAPAVSGSASTAATASATAPASAAAPASASASASATASAAAPTARTGPATAIAPATTAAPRPPPPPPPAPPSPPPPTTAKPPPASTATATAAPPATATATAAPTATATATATAKPKPAPKDDNPY